MNNWVIFAVALLATAGLLLGTVAAGVYSKEPIHKPYWDKPEMRQVILSNASTIGVKASEGNLGVVIIGYRDMINATNRPELLAVLREVITAARGYTVYLAPWADDNATKAYLTLLYKGTISIDDYLRGVLQNGTTVTQRVDLAKNLARTIAATYGTYAGTRDAPAPPIYVAIFRNDTPYVVYEPFTLGRDRTYTDWLQWVITALENLKQGQGRVTP
ncbi:hypothetical protein [Pyrobaculum sp.]|uniref:hypothetical protein n=1 Tax=Pyrobaculum sp. TaxID=2004705 RepID=UPI00317D5C25